jgi:hypothetical protein
MRCASGGQLRPALRGALHAPDLTVSLLGCCVSDGTDTYWDDVCDGQSWLPVDPLLANCLHTDFGHAIVQEGDMWRLAFAVGALGQARWVLEIHSPTKPRDAACNALSLFLRCFENQHQQWEYANLDTLTRLLNRKTFDDDFERLIAAAELAEQARKIPSNAARPARRWPSRAGSGWWISTTSRRSTTTSATSSATRCCCASPT